MKTFTVDTWLPVFSGTYETIWGTDSDEECEIQNINDERKAKGLPPVKWDDVEWDYDGHRDTLAEMIGKSVTQELQELGLVEEAVNQGMRSPREYNFANDSINVQFKLSPKNVEAIRKYLVEHFQEFDKYVLDRHTSRSGFISFHSNDANEWLADLQGTIEDKHKLGAVLNFILLNEDPDIEMDIYENVQGNGGMLYAKNYQELIGEKA